MADSVADRPAKQSASRSGAILCRARRCASRPALALALLLLGVAQAAAAERTLLVLGDSLSAGYGMAREQGWVSLLQARVSESHPDWRVVNASVSGETTAGGAARIASELATHEPDLVVLELGANDALRGLPLAQARTNLQRMIDAARSTGADVLLLGMRIPPNYGSAYAEAFAAMYLDLADQPSVALLPFLLEPIALDREAFMSDNVHPVAEAQPALLDHVWPALTPLLKSPD